MPRPIIIDTDPGQDDAVAILAALASPELDVVAITAVAGNVPLRLTECNARALVELADRADVPVYAGCERPMVNTLTTAEEVHGESGIDGADIAPPTVLLAPGHAVDRIVELALAAGSEGITLCPIGPLTNVAMAMVKEPSIVPQIREIVLMGGGFFEGGNVTPAAEFNMYVDPHAAHVVFTSGAPIVMMPLDVTHKALTSTARVARFRSMDTAAGTAVAGMLDFFDRYDSEKYSIDGAPLHDPCVIAYLLDPDLFDGRHVAVEIETAPGPTHGMTIVDWWRVTNAKPNATVMRDIDDAGFFDLLTDRIGRLP